MAFAQVVIGPPGSGKTTYCKGMKEFLSQTGRKVTIVNLDPANDFLPYDVGVDISDLVTLSDVMEKLRLGPNGGLVYCMEYLEKNLDWLKGQLDKFKDHYFLFDCPGQVELYTHHNSVRNIVTQLQKLNFKLVSVHLVDAHYCSDPAKFIGVLLTSLSTMLQMELPHVNLLSKIDLVEQYGRLAFNLDYFTEVLDLGHLLSHLEEDPFLKKFKKLNEALIGLVEDYSLVSFIPLNIQDKDSVLTAVKTIDKANGYAFGDLEERNLKTLMSCAVGADFEFFKTASVQEKYMQEDSKPLGEAAAAPEDMDT
ncbi:GPN-loop GTPase 2 [Strongylocentrotus purpuratus]|uniref:GPN-loop GTPase 2 n=1 Tax=Strongylocentrotus purpuratus TaxID=7668 RepID=A0A7M7RH09_STRPU|nr:GPN-loop GTPase 2 [Strongylocentrotus purpuratus]|eukprot:XP_011684212.1 PREDICTED: GPN-loop GTPase 2 [Strongylocentrotus purpuratus]